MAKNSERGVGCEIRPPWYLVCFNVPFNVRTKNRLYPKINETQSFTIKQLTGLNFCLFNWLAKQLRDREFTRLRRLLTGFINRESWQWRSVIREQRNILFGNRVMLQKQSRLQIYRF
jgi:hypothetical protein